MILGTPVVRFTDFVVISGSPLQTTHDTHVHPPRPTEDTDIISAKWERCQ
jgi:hypothetical protein